MRRSERCLAASRTSISVLSAQAKLDTLANKYKERHVDFVIHEVKYSGCSHFLRNLFSHLLDILSSLLWCVCCKFWNLIIGLVLDLQNISQFVHTDWETRCLSLLLTWYLVFLSSSRSLVGGCYRSFIICPITTVWKLSCTVISAFQSTSKQRKM